MNKKLLFISATVVILWAAACGRSAKPSVRFFDSMRKDSIRLADSVQHVIDHPNEEKDKDLLKPEGNK